MAEVNTVEGYCDWMKGFATITAPGATYDLHSASYDETTRTAVFATYMPNTPVRVAQCHRPIRTLIPTMFMS
ncbi:MAG: hypothetical protein R2867_30680 [Caldilineaceae bacterium]